MLFQDDGSYDPALFRAYFQEAARNYVIEPNDFLAVTVTTNAGERLVDPNGELEEGMPFDRNGFGMNGNGNQQMNIFFDPTNMTSIFQNNQRPIRYLVDENGVARLPRVGEVELAGLTLPQADSLLAERYSEYYVDPFVVTQYVNKRVVLMGALGDRVIPLRNEGMTLLEVLALAGGFQEEARASQVRLIRGVDDPEGPKVLHVDLTRMKTLSEVRLVVQSGDVIYVEPRRRFDPAILRDTGLIVSSISALTSLLTVVLLFDRRF